MREVLKLACSALFTYCSIGAKRRGGLKMVTVKGGFSDSMKDHIASSESFLATQYHIWGRNGQDIFQARKVVGRLTNLMSVLRASSLSIGSHCVLSRTRLLISS